MERREGTAAARAAEPEAEVWARAVAVALAVLLAGATGVFLWASNRGFDITDEGFYYLCFSHPEQVVASPWIWDLTWGSALFRLLGNSIPLMRIATLVAYAASASVFGWGFLAYVGTWWPGIPGRLDGKPGIRRAYQAQLVLLLVLSCFPIFWMPNALAYNQANGCALLGAMGCLLASASGPFDARAGLRGAMLAAGFATSLSAMAKFSAGLPFLFCATVAIFLVARWSVPERRRAALYLWAGFALGWAALFLFFMTPGRWWSLFHGGLAVLALLGSHGIGANLPRYAFEFVLMGSAAVRQQWPALLTFGFIAAAARLVQERSRTGSCRIWRRGLLLVVAVSFLDVVAYGFLRGRAGAYSLALPYGGLLLVTGLAAAVPSARLRARWRAVPVPVARERAALLALALAIPFIAVLGTNVPIAVNVCYQVAPWFAFGVLLATMAGRAVGSRLLPAAIVVGLAMLLVAQFVQGRILSPYRIPGSLLVQTEPVEVGAPAGSHMLLDRASATFFRGMRADLEGCGFRAREDVLAFFDMPGAAYAAGGVAPGHPWLPRSYEGSNRFIQDRLRSIDDRRVAGAWILEDDARRSENLLRSRGLPFPRSYDLCGTVLSPYEEGGQVRIWKPRSRGM